VVDDGSKDNMVTRIKDEIRKGDIVFIENKKNRGKGAAIKDGAKVCSGDFVSFVDADLPFPVPEMDKFLPLFVGANEVIIGIRDGRNINTKIVRSMMRKIASRLYNITVNLVFGLKIKDVGCGLKCFSSEMARSFFEKQRISGWVFDIELLLMARKRNIAILEIPVSWTDRSTSHVNIIRDAVKCLVDLTRIFYNNLLCRYE